MALQMTEYNLNSPSISLDNLTYYDKKIKEWVLNQIETGGDVKFISITSDKLNTIPVSAGQIIYLTDTKILLIDTDERIPLQQIIILANDDTRLGMVTPLKGFYFIENTSILWYYNSEWVQLTQTPESSLIFASRDDFPTTGKEQTLYIDEENIYQWNSIKQDYTNMTKSSELKWESF